LVYIFLVILVCIKIGFFSNLAFKIKILFFFKFYLPKTKVIVYLPTLLRKGIPKKATTEEPLF
jgi:hypothetical protein